MNQPPVFTDQDFALMEEALTDLKRSAQKAAKAKVGVETLDLTGASAGSFGAFLSSHFQKMAEEALTKHAEKADIVTLISAKMIELKRWQSQQVVHSTTVAQA